MRIVKALVVGSLFLFIGLPLLFVLFIVGMTMFGVVFGIGAAILGVMLAILKFAIIILLPIFFVIWLFKKVFGG